MNSMRAIGADLPEHQQQAISRAFELLNSSCVATSTADDLAAKFEACETSVRESLNGKTLGGLANMAREALDQLVELESANAAELRAAISETALEATPDAPGYFVTRFSVTNGGSANISSMRVALTFNNGEQRECTAYFRSPVPAGSSGSAFCDFRFSDIFDGQSALPPGASATAATLEMSFDDQSTWKLDATNNAEQWRTELLNISN